MTPPLTIEAVRGWLSTGILSAILFVLLRFGRPLIDFWIEKRKLDLQEKSQASSSRREEEEARHNLTIDLLRAARTEAANLETKLAQTDFDERYTLHMDEALRHIEAMINAKTDGERDMSIKLARSFLTRMQRLRDATGTMANERQRRESAVYLADQRELAQPGEDDKPA